LLGFEYRQGFNLASILVATVGAVVFLFILSFFSGEQRQIR